MFENPFLRDEATKRLLGPKFEPVQRRMYKNLLAGDRGTLRAILDTVVPVENMLRASDDPWSYVSVVGLVPKRRRKRYTMPADPHASLVEVKDASNVSELAILTNEDRTVIDGLVLSRPSLDWQELSFSEEAPYVSAVDSTLQNPGGYPPNAHSLEQTYRITEAVALGHVLSIARPTSSSVQ